MVLGEMELTGYQSQSGEWTSASLVEPNDEGQAVLKASGEPVKAVRVAPADAQKQGEGFVLAAKPDVRLESRAHKMSKSRGNVIGPDAVVREFGADALRLFEMFMGPLEATKPWSTDGVNGVRGFLDRVWRMIVNERSESRELNAAVQDVAATPEQNRVLHKTIQGVTQDLDRMAFNTAIAKLMEFTNYFLKCDVRPKSAMEALVLLLAPLAPHLSEELWQQLGHGESLAYEPWPTFDPDAVREATVEIPVQVNGKVRGRVTVPVDAPEAEVKAAARAHPRIAELLAGKTIVKDKVVPGRMVFFVIQ
jgi:leucyl-tRNA synthetase